MNLVTRISSKLQKMELERKAQRYILKKKENGFTTVELLIILAVICGIGVLWMAFKDEITAFFNKVMSYFKSVSNTIPTA